MIQFNPNLNQQMKAAGMSSVATPFAGAKNEDTNKNNMNGVSFGALGVTSPLSGGAVSVPKNQGANFGLVERLDKMDQMYQKPNHQNEFQANKLDIMA